MSTFLLADTFRAFSRISSEKRQTRLCRFPKEFCVNQVNVTSKKELKFKEENKRIVHTLAVLTSFGEFKNFRYELLTVLQ